MRGIIHEKMYVDIMEHVTDNPGSAVFVDQLKHIYKVAIVSSIETILKENADGTPLITILKELSEDIQSIK